MESSKTGFFFSPPGADGLWGGAEPTVPVGCKVDWAGMGGGGRVKVCNDETEEGRADAMGGSRAAWRGSGVA